MATLTIGPAASLTQGRGPAGGGPMTTQARPHHTAEEIRQAAVAIIADEQAEFNTPVLPTVTVNNRQLRESTAEAVAALHAANDPPEIFMRMGQLVRIQTDEDGRPCIKELSEAGLRHCLTQAADFIREGKDGSTMVSPPKDLVQNIMAAPAWPFPALRGIVEVPVLKPDGSILGEPGYDLVTRLYYTPAPGLAKVHILKNPGQKEAQAAAAFIFNELLKDFPFADDASGVNALGALLTPIVRPSIAGRVPLAVIDAPQAGTGKTIYLEIVGLTSTGRWQPMLAPPQRRDSDEEWGKVISSALLKGWAVIAFDNCDGALRSPSLAMALTAEVFSCRKLGSNEMPEIPVNVTWLLNGNNIQLGGDLPRRCYWIRLDARMSRPWERNDFRHKDLKKWAGENRGRLVASLLTMAKAWQAAGCPKPDTPKLGSFESWCDTVGGIIQFCGYDGFLGNLEAMYEKTDAEGQEWEAFLLAWRRRYGERVVLVKDLVGEVQGDDSVLKDALPGNLVEALGKKGGSFARTLGLALAKKDGAHFGEDGVHLVRVPKADTTSGANGWKVLNSLK